jgi:hypothetical protein
MKWIFTVVPMTSLLHRIDVTVNCRFWQWRRGTKYTRLLPMAIVAVFVLLDRTQGVFQEQHYACRRDL